MRSKLLTLFMAFAVVVALASELSVAALANPQNANKPAAPAKPKAHKRKKAAASSGIPTGVENCLNRLATLAAKEPLPKYDGQPAEIINNGMLWNDPKAKCAVTDQAQRKKLVDLATAWRLNDAAKVRSSLQEMGATAGPAEMAPAAKPKPHRRPAKKGAGAANKNA